MCAWKLHMHGVCHQSDIPPYSPCNQGWVTFHSQLWCQHHIQRVFGTCIDGVRVRRVCWACLIKTNRWSEDWCPKAIEVMVDTVDDEGSNFGTNAFQADEYWTGLMAVFVAKGQGSHPSGRSYIHNTQFIFDLGCSTMSEVPHQKPGFYLAPQNQGQRQSQSHP